MSEILTLASSDICKTPAFISDFQQLTRKELMPESVDQLNKDQVRHLLESCAVLSLSKSDSHWKLAYKIAVYLLNQQKAAYEVIPFVVQLVLTRLGDLPTIEHMINRGDAADDFGYFAPFRATPESESASLQMPNLYVRFPEILEKKIFNQIQIADKRTLTLTDFQALVLRRLKENYDYIFSAPTSAGKSYVLLRYLADQMFSLPSFSTIIVVPTKALVAEVQTEIRRILDELNIPGGYQVFTGAGVLSKEEIEKTNRKVLVLTQERLQDMLANDEVAFKVNLLVVDEAQQVASESRGIVIEDAVEELIKKDSSIQKVFISPYVANLDNFAKIFTVNPERYETRSTDKSPVGQNILFVTFKEGEEARHHTVTLSVLSQELQVDIGKNNLDLARMDLTALELKRLPKTISQRKVWVVKNLIESLIEETEPTLIYCNTRGDCRRLGRELAEELNEVALPSDELKEAIDFLKEHVHREYYLADLLKNRIAYHYGTMPQFVRFHVKELFEQKQITYLACTSTLLEGVNLPARNLVLYKPRRGPREMDTLSIRNLIGRAGRLKKDYYGKIYCIDFEKWEPPSNEVFQDKPENIESSSVTTLSEDTNELIEYLKNKSFNPSSSRAKSIKAMATSILMKQLIYGNPDFLQRFKTLSERISQENLDIIKPLLVDATRDISPFHRTIFLKNRSIDPRFQHELYLVLKQEGKRVLPPFPGRDNFYPDLKSIFRLIAACLLRQQNKSYEFYSYLANEWINGTPYKRILDGQILYNFRKNPPDERDRRKKINEIIENLDDTLETEIRFEYTRGLKCYCDIIGAILSEEGKSTAFCRDLPTYLEAGASDRNALFLIGSGLSRNVSIEICTVIRDLPKLTTVAETVGWLENNKSILQKKLHPILYKEVERTVGRSPSNPP